VGVDAFARGELRRGAGTAGDLAALARLQLDVVHHRTHRHVAQRHRIARLDRRIGAGAHFIAHRHAARGEDVATLAIGVLDQRDVRGAVRIVLERLDDAGDTVLVALEIDDAVLLARTTALVAGGYAAGVVARTGLALRHGQRSVRIALVQVRAVDLDDETRTRRRRLHFDQCHRCQSLLLHRPGFVVDRLAFGQTHVSLLPVLRAADALAEAALLAGLVRDL